MKPLKFLPVIGLAAGIVALTIGTTQAASISPTFDTFGLLPAATFGGSGIPNDAVAITTFVDGANTITLGMNATERFINPHVGDDGAGTFFAPTGANFGDPAFGPPFSANLGAAWNFNFYVSIAGGGVIGDYGVSLLYDFDPGAGTDESLLGEINFNGLGPLPFPLAEGSENLLFGFLTVPAPFLTPPPGAFDPDADAEYSFALRVSSLGGSLLGQSAINVIVGALWIGPRPSSCVPNASAVRSP